MGRMNKPCDVWFAGHFKIQSTLCSPNEDCGRPNERLRVRFPGKHFSRAWVLYLGYESLKSASRKRTLNGSFGLPQSWFGEHALDSSTCVSSAAFQNRRLGSVRLTRRLCTSDSLPLPTRFGLRITAIQSPFCHACRDDLSMHSTRRIRCVVGESYSAISFRIILSRRALESHRVWHRRFATRFSFSWRLSIFCLDERVAFRHWCALSTWRCLSGLR